MSVRFKTARTNADQILAIIQQYDQENIQPQLQNLEENTQSINMEISDDPNLDPNTYTDLGVLTDDVTITYPPTDPGVVQHYKGQFTIDPDGNYTVDFGNVVMTGDTEMHNYSTYVFDIVGGHGTLTEYRYGGFFGKVVSGFSGTSVAVSINGTVENIDVDANGWFFRLTDENTTNVKFNTTDKTSFEKLYCSGIKGNITDCTSMFSGCSNLTVLDVSNFNTANVTTMASMFGNCSNLTVLDVSNFNTANVTTMANMFQNCRNLTVLDVSNFNTANVTIMASMFSDCRNLTVLDVSNFNTANVNSMSSMFDSCQKMKSLDVSNFNTANVNSMSYMFRGCYALTFLDVSNFNTSKVTSTTFMFNGCELLELINVSNFNTANVTTMASMFGSCKKLKSLDVSNFNTAKVSTMKSMFNNCISLENLDLSSFNYSLVTTIETMFSNTTSLNTLNIDNAIYNSVINASLLFDNSNVSTIYLRNSDTDTYNIIDAAKPAGATIITA